jgi:hypothetical protein
MDESRFEELTGGYRASQVLFTACRLDIFEYLADRTVEVEELCRHVGGNRRGVRILLDSLASLGLLEKEDGAFRNSRAAR